MNGADPLAQLRDIHLPADIGWFPPAPGWWLLGLLLLAALVFGLWRVWILYKAKAYRREALRELNALHSDWQHTSNPQQYLSGVNQLLKRVALRSFPRQTVASLSGPAWLEFLDQHWRKPPTQCFGENPLLSRLYALQSASIEDPLAADALNKLASEWIAQHRAESC